MDGLPVTGVGLPPVEPASAAREPRRPRLERWRFAGALAVLAVALGLGGQALLGTPVFGPFGLALVVVPAVLLVEAIGRGRRWPWPERLLGAIGGNLAITVLAGVVAALSGRGIDAVSVALVELIILGYAVGAWLAARRIEGVRAVLAAPVARVELPRPELASQAGSGAAIGIAFVLAGGLLGATGFVIAAQAAQRQFDVPVVQFWTTPTRAGQPTIVGVGNDSGATLHCSVTVARPGSQTVGFQIDALADGQPWEGQLPLAGAGETARWQLVLACTGGAAPVQRLLLIDPPGRPLAAASPVPTTTP